MTPLNPDLQSQMNRRTISWPIRFHAGEPAPKAITLVSAPLPECLILDVGLYFYQEAKLADIEAWLKCAYMTVTAAGETVQASRVTQLPIGPNITATRITNPVVEKATVPEGRDIIIVLSQEHFTPANDLKIEVFIETLEAK